MNDVTPEPSRTSLWLAAIGVIAGFLLFAVLLYVSYLPGHEHQDTTPVFSAADMKELDQLAPAERAARMRELRWERHIPTPEDRRDKLIEIRDHEAAALTNYSWIDRDKGVVRLPIERAKQLALQELTHGAAAQP